MPIIECRELTRRHAGGIVPVRGVTLAISAGEMISITGPSGSGKTSLLALLGLLDTPTDGLVRISGTDVTNVSEQARALIRSQILGFVFQSFHLLSARTALENVAVGMLYSGRPRRERLERASELLVGFGMGHRLDAYASTLSGGEQQRVAMARALVSQPKVLLCDEPTGNLDTKNTDQLLDSLVELNRNGLAIVIVTHDMNVAGIADTHYEMSDGRLSLAAESAA